ncbi:MAG TPA: pyridoxal-phosphate dependent enzyme [Planktothrix sp.]|jgi:cysteine synthase B
MIVKQVTELIGNTPMLEIDPEIHGLKNINLFAKLELFNPFGSVKDKTAWNMLRHDLDAIKAKGQIVIESSSGNTAKAVQMICGIQNIPFKIVTNRVRVKEVKQILQLLGTEIEELPGQSQCLDPSDPNDPLFVVEKIMNSEPGRYFHTTQYTNELNTKAHAEMTGTEIAQDLQRVDYFVGGLGTTGSTRGAGETLKAQNPRLANIGVVSSKNGFIPGIRNSDEMFEVGLFDRNFYDAVVEVSIDEALDGMMMLIKRCGVLSGPTGGASLAGTLKYLKTIDQTLAEKQNAVFLVCDRVEWYLSFLQKLRPQWFGLNVKETGLKTVTEEQLNSVKEITADQLQSMVGRGEPMTLVDLRGGLAFKGSHIDTSVNMPAEMLEELLQWSVPFSQSKPVVFVCPVGDQSRRFSAYITEAGFNSMSLEGGFAAWRDNEKPVVKARKRTDSKPVLSA